jgi:hypothetical protein
MSLFLPFRRHLITPLVRDSDARDFIRRVETADGQPLENNVRRAFDQLVLGCKADGNWNAIKTCVPMIGARTLAGSLVPLVGTAPTNFNFVSGDYDRKNGLTGNGINKYLDSNRNSNADPQNNVHHAVYVTALPTSGNSYIGVGAGDPGATNIVNSFHRNRNQASQSYTEATGFIGFSRSSSSAYSFRSDGVTTSHNIASETSFDASVFIFARANALGAPFLHSNTGIAFYSIGESLDLALLDARVKVFFNAIAAAIS